MKNAVIVGFTSNSQSNVIYKCIKENIFECKLWISNKSKHPNSVKVQDLFNPDTLKQENNNFCQEYEDIFNKYFHIFVHSMSREKSIDFTYFEFVNLFTLQFYYYYNLIKREKINLLIATNFMHEADYLLYPIAHEIFNLEIIIFNQTPFTNKFWYVDSLEDYGIFNKLKSLNNNSYSNESITDDMKIDVFYMKKTFSKRIKANCLFNFLFKDFEKIFNKRRNIKLYQQYIKYRKCKEYKNNMNMLATNELNLDEKYVYCPLHLQPELTTSILGDKYSDQLLMIEKLSNIIPEDWKIYVKENPYQTFFQRDKLFFKRLMTNNKIVLIKDISSNVLIKNCQFLANISGTAGWEALQVGKAVVLFGKAWYRCMPGSFMFDELDNIEDVINYTFEKEKFIEEFNTLLSSAFNGIVDDDYLAIYSEYDEKKNTNLIYEAITKVITRNGLA